METGSIDSDFLLTYRSLDESRQIGSCLYQTSACSYRMKNRLVQLMYAQQTLFFEVIDVLKIICV